MAILPVSAAGPDSPYDYSVRRTLLDPSGLEGVSRLVQLSFIYEACGYLNRNFLVAVTDRGLVPEAPGSRRTGARWNGGLRHG